MRLILDAGALVALERNDRAMWRRMKAALLEGSVPVTHGGVVGQTWRGRGPRQALLASASGRWTMSSGGKLGFSSGERARPT